MAGRRLVVLMVSTAALKSPFWIQVINSGIGIPTGQPFTQGRFLQFKHRAASILACSSVYPIATSSMSRARAWGSSTGISCIGISLRSFMLNSLSFSVSHKTFAWFASSSRGIYVCCVLFSVSISYSLVIIFIYCKPILHTCRS